MPELRLTQSTVWNDAGLTSKLGIDIAYVHICWILLRSASCCQSCDRRFVSFYIISVVHVWSSRGLLLALVRCILCDFLVFLLDRLALAVESQSGELTNKFVDLDHLSDLFRE